MEGFNTHVTIAKLKNAKVFVRIFPTAEDNEECVKILNDCRTLYVKCLQDFSMVYPGVPFFWKFNSDGVLYNANQHQVYYTVVEDCVDHAINGHSTIFFGYGQTGTGKTFTMSGLYYNFEQRGLAPRLIPAVIKMKETLHEECQIDIGLSYVEMRGNEFYDLLNAHPWMIKNTKLYNPFKNVNIFMILSVDQAMELLFEGEGRRKVHDRAPYPKAHLCTSVLTLYIVCTSLKKTNPIQTLAKIHVVDMISADNSGGPSCNWKSWYDVGLGNKNKTQMEIFLMVLRDHSRCKSTVQSSKRKSLLVHYLADCLHTRTILRFICHIRNTAESLPVTLSMLRFAQNVMGLEPERVEQGIRNVPQLEMENLRDEFEDCMNEAFRSAIFSDNDLAHYMTQSRLQHLNRAAQQFLSGSVSDLALLNVSHASTVLKLFKDMYQQVANESANNVQKAYERGLVDGHRAGSVGGASAGGKELRKVSKSKLRTSKENLAVTTGKSKASTPATTIMEERGSRAETASVGGMSRAGQGMGPGVMSSHESSLARSARKEETPRGFGTREGGQPMPNREEAWALFLGQPTTIQQIEQVSQLQKKLDDLQVLYTHDVQQLYSLRCENDNNQKELMKAQMKRHLTKMEDYSPDGLIIPSDEEKKIRLEMAAMETQIRYKEDVIFVNQNDLKLLADQVFVAKKELEAQFQEFCKQTFKIPMPVLYSTLDHHPEIVGMQIIANDIEEFEKNDQRKHKAHQKKMAAVTKYKKLCDFYLKRRWNSDFLHYDF